jgi:hypothetical protein
LTEFERREGKAISKDPAFTECVFLDGEAFDPDAVFLDDIVNDDVLPKLSLAVDGLTTPVDGAGGGMEMPSEDTARNRAIKPSTTLPATPIPSSSRFMAGNLLYGAKFEDTSDFDWL